MQSYIELVIETAAKLYRPLNLCTALKSILIRDNNSSKCYVSWPSERKKIFCQVKQTVITNKRYAKYSCRLTEMHMPIYAGCL